MIDKVLDTVLFSIAATADDCEEEGKRDRAQVLRLSAKHVTAEFVRLRARLEVAQRLADALAELRRWYGTYTADQADKKCALAVDACDNADHAIAEWERTK